MTQNFKSAKSGDVLGRSRPFWTKTTELCFNYYAIIGCFYYGKLEKNIVLKILKSQILTSYY